MSTSPLHSPHSRFPNPFKYTVQPPTPSTTGMKRLARVRERDKQQNSYFAHFKNFAVQLSISGGISYMTGNPAAFAAVVANKCVNGGTLAVQKIGNYTFPQINTNWKKLVGLAISAPVVWVASDRAGYPLGYLFLMGVTINAASTLYQARQGLTN